MRTLLFLLNAAAELQTGFILKPERKITSPSQTFILEARFRPKSQIYRMSQGMRFAGNW